MMADVSERIKEIFFEIFESLPRQGPGSRSSTKKALDFCTGLPTSPTVLDLGCGSGAQTFHLAELTAGTIVAIDKHSPNIMRLKAEVNRCGLDERIRPLIGDIGKPEYSPGIFDIIWSEGALYNIGIGEALRLYHSALKPCGYFAFTEAVWCREDIPPDVMALFEDYADMGRESGVLAKIEANGYSSVNHFMLPNEDWWDDFYTPMEFRIRELRNKYRGDTKSLAALEELACEPELHRRHSDCYGYEFFVAQKK